MSLTNPSHPALTVPERNSALEADVARTSADASSGAEETRRWARFLPHRLFRNMSIRARLAWGLGGLVLLTVLVGATAILTDRAKAKARDAVLASNQETFLAERLKTRLLEARANESAFLMQYASVGYDQAYRDYVLAHQKNTQQIRELLAEVHAIEVDHGNQSELSTLGEIDDATQAYETSFAEVVALIKTRGSIYEGRGLSDTVLRSFEDVAQALADSGDAEMEAEARHTVEEYLEYLLAPGSEAQDAVQGGIATLQNGIRGGGPTADEAQPLSTLIEKGADSWNELVALDAKITEKRNAFEQAAASVGPLVEDFVEEEHQGQEQALASLTALEKRARNTSVALVVLTVALGATLAFAITASIASPISRLTTVAAQFGAGDLEARADIRSGDEIGRLAATFNEMAGQLGQTVGALEERVAERTRELALAAEVGRSLSMLRHIDDLLVEAVERIRARFNLYYAQIYLVSDSSHSLVLRAGTGELGAELMRRQHSLPIGPTSINGTAADRAEAVIVSDTSISPIFQPNLLLPDTRSEMAIPLLVGEKVIGVLDLQSDQPNALTRENLPAFESLASQLSVAIENANMFMQTSQAQAMVDAQMRRLARASWEDFLNAIDRGERIGYRYALRELTPLHEPLPGEVEDGRTLSAPIAIAGAEVGAIQIVHEEERAWTPEDADLVTSVAEQVAQQIENLRLLSEADRYRSEAEQATRRLIREGWEDYQRVEALQAGYAYDLEAVRPLDALPETTGDERISAIKQALTVRGQKIGELSVVPEGRPDPEASEMAAVIAERLSAHIENLRLTRQTELALTEAWRQSEELLVINRVVSKVSSSLDLKQSMQIVADELAAAISVDQIGIALLNDDRSSLTVIAEHFDPARSTSALGIVIPVEGNPLTQYILETQQRAIVTDAQESSLTAPVRESMRMRGVHTLVVLPMVVGNEVVGTVGIDILEPDRTLTEDQLRLAETIIYQAATAVQNARLFSQLQSVLKETEALYQATAELNLAQNYHDILAALRRHTLLGRGADNISLNIFDRPWSGGQTPEWIQVLAYWWTEQGERPSADDMPPRFALADFPSATTLLRADAPAVIQDVATDPNMDENARALYRDRFHAASTIFVPLVVGRQWIGYINGIYRQRAAFAEADLRHLMSLAGQAAVAVQSIRLLEETQSLLQSEQRQRRIADSLVRAANRMSQTLNEAELRQVLVDEIYDILRPDQVILYAWNEGEQAFVLDRKRPASPRQDEDTAEPGVLIRPAEKQDLWRVFEEEVTLLENLSGENDSVRIHYCLPWRIGEKAAGVIEVFDTGQDAVIRPEDQIRCEGIVQEAAVAFERIRLLEETARRAQREHLLREITARVRSSADIDTVMRTAVQEIGRALGRQAFIHLGNGNLIESDETPEEETGS